MRQAGVALALATVVPWCPPAASAEAETVERIRSAAAEISLVQEQRGNDSAIIAIADCYDRTSAPGSPLEVAQKCATQDWVISEMSIAFFEQLGTEGKKNHSYQIALDAPGRIATLLLEKKKLSHTDARAFTELMKQHAIPAFVKARYGCEAPPCQ